MVNVKLAATDRYTKTSIVLHWAIASLAFAQFAWGWWMQGIAKIPPGPRVDAFNLHKSVGLTILLLMVVRLGWRLAHRTPPLPAMPAWQSRLAQGSHWAMYAALFAMPIAGYLGSVFSGYPIKYFGWTLPAWGVRQPPLKDAMSQIHLYGSWVLAFLVTLHIAGAMKHALIARDGLLARMWPGR
jgi:cytochrome b561